MGAPAVKPIDPYPDRLYGVSKSLDLAIVAALHRLPPRERAVVALADVDGFGVAEIATALETTTDWVGRALHRGRRAIAAASRDGPPPPEPESAIERRVVERLRVALENVDPERAAAVLADEVTLGCTRRWAVYCGPETVAHLLCERMVGESLRLVPTRANGQPAFGCYTADSSAAAANARGLLAITLAGEHVIALTRFWDNAVLAYFGLPETLPRAHQHA
jgi:RNA polymerase sigma-70 factor (ECF subfamily)